MYYNFLSEIETQKVWFIPDFSEKLKLTKKIPHDGVYEKPTPFFDTFYDFQSTKSRKLRDKKFDFLQILAKNSN